MRLVMLATAVIFSAAAVATTPPSWTLEPASVFGIAPGRPFPSPREIADCPAFAPFRREPQDDGPCVDPRDGFSAESIVVKNMPLTHLQVEARVSLHDGIVRAITMQFEREHFAAVKSELIERYGPPQRHVSGAHEHLTWIGSRISLQLRAGDGAADQAVLEFSDSAPPPAEPGR